LEFFHYRICGSPTTCLNFDPNLGPKDKVIDFFICLRHYLAVMPVKSLTILHVLSVLLCCLVPTAPAIFATKKPPPAPVNINTATSEQLQEVPGIGPATAEKILQMRKSYGAFKSVDDLLSIKGIGKKRLEKMRKYLTVGKAAVPAKPGSTNATAAKKAVSPSTKRTPPTPPASTDSEDSEEPPFR
jgi:competence ComEA-like helix-hairpin-helix protein